MPRKQMSGDALPNSQDPLHDTEPASNFKAGLSPDKDSGGVAAVDRALTILHTFKPGDSSLSLTDIANRTGFNKSTILRLNQSLERFGYLVRGADRRYRIGPSAWRLGVLFQRELELEDRVMPHIRELAGQTSETVAFWIPLLNSSPPLRLCLLRVESPHEVAHNFRVGDTMSLGGTGEEEIGTGGRVMRAFLFPDDPQDEAIRSNRVFSSCGARDPDLLGVAAPVFKSSGELAGIVSLSAPTSRRDHEWARSHESLVLATADHATLALGGAIRPDRSATPG